MVNNLNDGKPIPLPRQVLGLVGSNGVQSQLPCKCCQWNWSQIWGGLWYCASISYDTSLAYWNYYFLIHFLSPSLSLIWYWTGFWGVVIWVLYAMKRLIIKDRMIDKGMRTIQNGIEKKKAMAAMHVIWIWIWGSYLGYLCYEDS